MRKIIQIATTQSWDEGEGRTDISLWALCDDGTVWVWVPALPNMDREEHWRQLEDIPAALSR